MAGPVILNVPNTLSFLRIFSAPLFIWLLLNDWMNAALWLFLVAGVTDAVDGFIAKRFGLQTELGAYLDPLADKLLLLSGFITLSVIDVMPLWMTLLVVTRDLVIVGGALVYQLATGALRMEPLIISKLNTVAQITLLVAVLAEQAFGAFEWLFTPLLIFAALTTAASGLAYTIEWTRRATSSDPGGAP
ncbi:CDP-alcohol phosphatidyltransferase family protein [Magnetofaba australis]|uniref:CDP-diacylglycerol--glycerol-3-phosphate 3-phosphatidyltransferase n=1 Tax=Magnetofaba australis IT-1 TaxID=1434232 RepID=A0A1Y2K6T5_9PROT|nr:CDP-alcohol phosphatidyltransferase family protein [Magnetofaba australis]OSM05058.1 putative CDP-alcohol phosphatidyltransferase [Magnetofaba australis IT-1]